MTSSKKDSNIEKLLEAVRCTCTVQPRSTTHTLKLAGVAQEKEDLALATVNIFYVGNRQGVNDQIARINPKPETLNSRFEL